MSGFFLFMVKYMLYEAVIESDNSYNASFIIWS